jgi:rhamnogalacturonyl hydrolase YesR
MIPRNEIIGMMRKVCDWQLAHMPDSWLHPTGRSITIRANGWIRATFFTGVMALWRMTKDPRYLDAAREWAESNRWLPGPRPRHADDHCACQAYAELCAILKNPKTIAPTQATLQKLVSNPRPGRQDWWWCDALFMAPPAMIRLSALTDKKDLLDTMDAMWWDTTAHLFDETHKLFYRDAKYKRKRTAHGQKVFWSRGNGWVLAGIARVLPYLHRQDPRRRRYKALFRQMVDALVNSQHADGRWRTSLLDADEFPSPETSGTGLLCFALAWGINDGILKKEWYMPVVKNAWYGLVESVDKNGRLGWVQLPGDSPAPVLEKDTMEYGCGAFLLAGSEIVKLVQ